MKTKAAILLATAPVLCAGTPEMTPAPAAAEYWITPTIDIRARYEVGHVEDLDTSNALTFRERLGLQTIAWNGFSGFVEGEFLQAAVDDYNAGAPGAYPSVAGNTVISDPETNELNQGYLQYDGYGNVAKVGRQRIIYDNAAFIGNVGWRQDEQTFDAFSLTNKCIDGLTFNYAYVDQVNRIFGSDAIDPFKAVSGNINLINASYTGFSGITLGGYAYLMDFDDTFGPNDVDNNTFGLSAKGDTLGLTLYGELAWQDKAGAAANDDALYAHVTATKAFGPQSVTLGVESLGQGFKTPLATVHAFNGFADAFIGGRINGNHNGLTDLYVSHTMPIFCGVKWTNVLHAFDDNTFGIGYGWEYDSVLAKKFDDHFTAIAKLSYFASEGDAFIGSAALPDTTRFSVELDYKF